MFCGYLQRLVLGLPVASLTNMCGKIRNVRYLENFKNKCAQFDLSEANFALDAENYFKNLTVLSVPLRPKNASVKFNFQVRQN